MQESLGLKSRDGALVQSVEKGMPADKAGIRHEDVIVRVDQTPVKNNRDLIDYVSGKAPGTKVTITFIRDGKEKTTVATLETRREEAEGRRGREAGADENREKIGISQSTISRPALAREFHSTAKDDRRGRPDPRQARLGRRGRRPREGDVVQEVNGSGRRLPSADFRAAAEEGPRGSPVRAVLRPPARSPRPANFIAAVRLKD